MGCLNFLCSLILALIMLGMWAVLIYIYMWSSRGVIIVNVSYFPAPASFPP